MLTLLAMEPPTKADGPESGESIRNAKVQVLNSIPPITIDECFLGQYEGMIRINTFHEIGALALISSLTPLSFHRIY